MFTPETKSVIIQVASGIAPDVGFITDPVEMAEDTIDANRLVTFGGSDGAAAEREVIQLIDSHGYNNVLEEIAKFIPCN